MKEGKRVRDLETVVTLSAVVLLFYLIFEKRELIILSFLLLIISLVFKKFTAKFSDLWLKFSRIIGGLNSKILLSSVFYFLLTPISVIYRFHSKDPLILKKNNSLNTYFFDRNYSFKKEDFEKIW